MKLLLAFVLFSCPSAWAGLSTGVMIQGQIENFDQKIVELNVSGKHIVVPRHRITERVVRSGVHTSALLPLEEIKPSPYRRIASESKSPFRKK